MFNSSSINNPYVTMNGGMGCTWYVRKNNDTIEGFFMHSDNYGQYGPDTDHRPYLEQFIEGYQFLNIAAEYVD